MSITQRSLRAKCELSSISSPTLECFTICSLWDDLNDKALASFEAKGTRVSTKLHSLLAYSHPIHMLILQVTAGRRTYRMKRFAVRFIPTIISKVYPDAFVGRNRANMEDMEAVLLPRINYEVKNQVRV